jgi:hypothetical protein
MAEEEQKLKKEVKDMPLSEAYKTAEKKKRESNWTPKATISEEHFTFVPEAKFLEPQKERSSFREKLGEYKEKLGKEEKDFLKRQKGLENKNAGKERETYNKALVKARTKEIGKRAKAQYKAVHSYTPPQSVFGGSMFDFGNIGMSPHKSAKIKQSRKSHSVVGDFNIGFKPSTSPMFSLPSLGRQSKGRKKRGHQFLNSPI